MNTPAPNKPGQLKNQAAINGRWKQYSACVVEQIKKLIDDLKIDNMCYIHEDLTGENLLIVDEKITIIDFGDTHSAPPYYEYPPIIFDLFNFDKTMIDEFKRVRENFSKGLFFGTILHDFSGNIIALICEKKLRIKMQELKDIGIIRDYIYVI